MMTFAMLFTSFLIELKSLQGNKQMLVAALRGVKGDVLMFMLHGEDDIGADEWYEIYAAGAEPHKEQRARGCRGCKSARCVIS